MSKAHRTHTEVHRVATVSVTCLQDGWAHRVSDVELAGESGRNSGYYQALCGHRVAAASMVEPDGRPCPLCSEMCRAS